ncbi:PBSX family phage terminase large subunit [Xenorhabdus anantnagensis]|uniref:PBSX family phage terminase large subunit n=1 Tax=Xenorhabdus anantnagensis TaxID=3025875 RepID=A0ABT5LYC0_9GAMM|nr:PBSX family phage terminase large subunit [Xenorhabdus anantnagensis]MDC9598838.1 PBSX family phage terminase large subunit [Xenorhabdus anantnagensis]
MTIARIELPPKLIPVFSGDYRYRGSYGGRGSAKTRSFAKMTAIRGYMFAEAGVEGVILCGREYMNSLSESSMEEVKQAIRAEPWLDNYYEMGENYIRTRNRRVWYVFAGLRHNLDSIKSKARILIAWIDEAESVSEVAWRKLIPTVREIGSEIWITWNPEINGSPTDKRFRQSPPDNSCIVEMNYGDNPWFPDVLEQERVNDQARLDASTYAWIWEGAYLENSDKQVLANKYKIESFPDDLWQKADRLLFGGDFGFAKDPSTLLRMFILDNCLYIDREAYGVGVELDHMPAFYDKVPGSRKWPIKADSARPETISYLKRQGFNIAAAKKWQGSVEDGISYLRGFTKIIIHPRCEHTAKEARLYSYKTDRITGEVLPVIEDANNHCWDAARYGLDGYIKGRTTVWDIM